MASNTKIMVNFNTQKIVGCKDDINSERYRKLIEKGYVRVGKINQSAELFVENDFFEPEDKYLRKKASGNLLKT